ncbi:MAG: hypothetical protein KAR45_15370, partial [Desulfobacteraceae bacterium]|nr:hypothetical protein [Desulfobacteraceae bacterium]
MKQAAFLVLIFVVCLFYPLGVFSVTSTQNTPSPAKVNPNIVKKPVAKSPVIKKELPINIALEKKDKNLYVKLNRVPAKVDLFTHKISLHTFMGKGNTRFNITPYLSKVRKNSITVFAHSTRGTKYQKTFNLSKYLLPLKKKKGAGKIISPIQRKSKKQSGFKKKTKGPIDHTRVRAETFIPGGIRLAIVASGSGVQRGTPVTVTYQFIRPMDHLPEEIEFRVVPRLSSMPGDLLKTIRFDSERPDADVSATRETSLLLPFGLREGGSYTINARSIHPAHSGKTSIFRISTPDRSLGVYTPDSSDRFPP